MAVLTSARGLVTSSSELTRADGAMSVAENVNVDYDNVIEQRRGFSEFGTVIAGDVRAKQLMVYKGRTLRHYANKLGYDSNGSGAYLDFSGLYDAVIENLRIKYLEANGNFYFTTDTGVKKISATSESSFTQSAGFITQAGGVKAVGLEAILAPESSGWLPAQSKAAYRLAWGTKDVNGNLILGSPSSRTVIENTSRDVNIGERFNLKVLIFSTLVNSDYFLFDTPTNKYAVWFDVTGAGVPPSTADTVNRSLIEVTIFGIVAPDNNKVAAAIATALSALSDVTVEISTDEVTVTNVDGGNVTNPSQGTVLSTEILVSATYDGQTQSGTPANANLTFVIPSQITTTDYFYQLYRTGVVTVATGLTLNDIDPGDECQLVYELGLTSADLIAGSITVEDITPETFRAGGAYLYTNPVTGGGIASANEAPPICTDIALFKGSVFYSNTKELHRKQFNLLSVSDFVSGTSKFYVGNANRVCEYTFVGVAQVVQFTVQAKSLLTENAYIVLSSANNERKYKLWLDMGIAPVEPTVAGTISVRIPLETYPNTNQGTKDAIIDALLDVDDFSALDTGAATLSITNTNNGNSAAPVASVPASGITFSVLTIGDGENAVAKEVLLSGLASAGQSVEETARSLERVINQDDNCPVNAFYLSGPDDLPGVLLLEARSLEDVQFYLGVKPVAITSKFNPEIPSGFTITAISNVNNRFTTSTAHGYSIGQEVYVHDNISGVKTEIAGKYKIATVPTSTTFTLTSVTPGINQPSITGIVYLATVNSDNSVNPNRVYFSKFSQPEAVPLVNYIDIGPKDKQIRRILALRDSLIILKDDGVYLISGSVAPNFSVRLVDGSSFILAPDSAAVLNNLVYMLSSQGVATVSETGVAVISRNIENLISEIANAKYNYKLTSFGIAYESDRSYTLWMPTKVSDTTGTQAFRYNSFTRTWTKWTKAATCAVVNPSIDKLYLGSGDNRYYVLQERKNLERQDYSDRDFAISLLSVNDTSVAVSSVSNIEAGDVLVQTQYLDIPKWNRMLKKLDKDSANFGQNFYANYKKVAGANMADAITDLVALLNTIGFTIPTPSGTNTPTAVLADYNVLIGELNDPTSPTKLKDYVLLEADHPLYYEVLVTAATAVGNLLTINFTTWLQEGSIQVYKAIKSEVEYAPQHFGTPEKTKQISEGTFIFDQTNFYGGTVGYASDLSKDFETYSFSERGPGFWGSYDWADIVWGGNGSETPVRTLIPQAKQRCRFLHIKFKHFNAREKWRLLGVSLEPREVGPRGYR